MTTPKFDKIKALRSEATTFASFHSAYAENYASDSHCDKKGFGFGRNDRFTAFRVNTHFASWKGFYGNSSCSTIMSVYHRDLVEPYVIKALNVHQREIFATVARLMREDAAKMTGEAEAEIAAMQALLAEARADGGYEQEVAA